MSLKDLQSIHNQYFVIRHGYSKANELAIVLSHPEHGRSDDFTLTEIGEKQVFDSVNEVKGNGLLDSNTIIISSPYSRCKRSAEIAKEVLGISDEIIFDDRLSERWFGNFERQPNTSYQLVWEKDARDSTHEHEGVESADAVQQRTAQLIKDLEGKYKGKKILLVSHGDALQIMQTAFGKESAAVHRSLPHLETAEIRQLFLK